MDNNFGFIITRHVNSEKTNLYWNNCVKLLRTFYPDKQIIIIDDNSDYKYVKQEFEYQNITIIQSEFPKRGELLPYYYFLKNKFFNNAVIIHDSVFIHKRINFEKLNGIDIFPLWHFEPDRENIGNTKRIMRVLKNNYLIDDKISMNNIIGLNQEKWYGCFGVQSYINFNFLEQIEKKYNITNLISQINCRNDRCCLERIFGAIFFKESSKLYLRKSLFGNIYHNQKWGYTYDEYNNDLKKGSVKKIITKVWTGR